MLGEGVGIIADGAVFVMMARVNNVWLTSTILWKYSTRYTMNFFNIKRSGDGGGGGGGEREGVLICCLP